jgi:hypothetical protein
MFNDKADKKDIELLKLSIDPHRAKTLFNDMKELFDSSIDDCKRAFEKEKDKMREAFSFMLKESQDKCDRRELSRFQQRVDKIEKHIMGLELENGKLREQVSLDRVYFALNKTKDDL